MSETILAPDLCYAYDMGMLEYSHASELQANLAAARLAGEVTDIILLLQHHPVFTIGTLGSEANIVVSQNKLENEGIAIFHADRGGDITYHGPGQLVGYLIFDLKGRSKDLHQYMRNLEEIVILTLADFSVAGHRLQGYPGVWVEGKKICSVGIRVTRWVTKHGFAFNVNNDLRAFSYINPCGIKNGGVTSMSRWLRYQLVMEDVFSRVLKYTAQVFDINIKRGSAKQLSRYYAR